MKFSPDYLKVVHLEEGTLLGDDADGGRGQRPPRHAQEAVYTNPGIVAPSGLVVERLHGVSFTLRRAADVASEIRGAVKSSVSQDPLTGALRVVPDIGSVGFGLAERLRQDLLHTASDALRGIETAHIGIGLYASTAGEGGDLIDHWHAAVQHVADGVFHRLRGAGAAGVEEGDAGESKATMRTGGGAGDEWEVDFGGEGFDVGDCFAEDWEG